MAEPFSRLISELNRRMPGIHGQCAETWGSRHPAARQAIRDSLKNSFSDWNKDDYEALANLEYPPRPYHRSVSVSHTHDFGGWMSVARPTQIGWDVELKARIKDAIITRVCSRQEISEAPQFNLLWCAKEAFYKALEDDQPDVIQQLTITGWKALEPGLWSWQGLGARNGEGLVLDSEPWIMASCLII